MHVQQKISLLVFPKWKKADSEGNAPLYIRIKIDGEEEELSLGCKTKVGEWNPETKRTTSAHPQQVAVNKKIARAVVDLERHFDLVQACEQKATPAAVKTSYIAPPIAKKAQENKYLDLEVSEELDQLINRFIMYSKRVERANELKDGLSPERLFLLETERKP